MKAAVGSSCPYFSVADVTIAIAADSNRMVEVFELDSASGDLADFHRPCIAWLVLHHCCLADLDLDMVVAPVEPTINKKNRSQLIFHQIRNFSEKIEIFTEKVRKKL